VKDLYKTLGITPDATAREIKTAYTKLALVTHPDKGGDAEKMQLLNDAYNTLSDPSRRRDFDTNMDYQNIAEGYLQAGNSVPYSHRYRTQHQSLVEQYEKTPLMQKSMDDHIQPFQSSIYHIEENGIAGKQYHDIYTFIHAKTSISAHLVPKVI